jgi:hypothetical protein
LAFLADKNRNIASRTHARSTSSSVGERPSTISSLAMTLATSARDCGTPTAIRAARSGARGGKGSDGSKGMRAMSNVRRSARSRRSGTSAPAAMCTMPS